MAKLLPIACIVILLNACGAPPKPTTSPTQHLIAALVAQNLSQVISQKGQTRLNIKNQNIVNLYSLVIKNQPYQLLSSSQRLLNNYHHYSPAQQSIIKPMLLWAYAHPIYRQETAKQVRLLQREELLVAPSKIDFVACESEAKGCANTLRQQVLAIISPPEFTSTLLDMANNDPCINLSDDNMGGDFGNQCLASRKGNLKVNLLSPPQFLYGQWEAAFNSTP